MVKTLEVCKDTPPDNTLIIKAPNLDPIRVLLWDYEPGVGRAIVDCYDSAWSLYWGAMGDATIAQFIASSEDVDYIASNMDSRCPRETLTNADEFYEGADPVYEKSARWLYTCRVARALIDGLKEWENG